MTLFLKWNHKQIYVSSHHCTAALVRGTEAAAHQANRLMSTWIEKRYAKLIDGMDTMDLRDMFSGNDIK